MTFVSHQLKLFNDRFFRTPKQVKKKHYRIVAIFGKLGFLTKSFIYATIGGLTCESAFTSTVHNESPQGVFILFGSVPSAAGRILLICMLAGVFIYATWRFWEGSTGQGYDSTYSKKKNFFRYRLSPLASGGVYVAYGIYIITLFVDHNPIPPGSSFQRQGSCFPVCWKSSIIGSIGLGILALAFTIATVTQLVPAFTGNFRNEMDFNRLDSRYGIFVKYQFLVCGHLGFFARSVLFFLVCFLFWEVLVGRPLQLDVHQSTVGQAINGIRTHLWGRIIMGALGIGLILYGLFAFMCIYFKIFPTPPPSQNSSLYKNNNTPTVLQIPVANNNLIQMTILTKS